MFIPPSRMGEKATDPATAMFRFWISFWPVAPLFGVKWRFADMTVPLHGNLAARPADLARAGAEVQERVTEEAAKAPALAEPAAEEAAEKAAKAPARTVEREIEQTMEPEAADTVADEDANGSGGKKPRGLKAKAPAEPDDLKLIKGIGPSLERQLNGLGIYSFEQIAKLDEDELRWVDEQIETVTFKGRCFRDDWVGQAKAQLG